MNKQKFNSGDICRIIKYGQPHHTGHVGGYQIKDLRPDRLGKEVEIIGEISNDEYSVKLVVSGVIIYLKGWQLELIEKMSEGIVSQMKNKPVQKSNIVLMLFKKLFGTK